MNVLKSDKGILSNGLLNVQAILIVWKSVEDHQTDSWNQMITVNNVSCCIDAEDNVYV